MTLKEKGDLLKESVEIVEVISALGIKTTRKGDCYFLPCPNPYHTDTHATNCYFKKGWKNVLCLACGTSIKAIDLVINILHCSYKEAVDFLEQLEGGNARSFAVKGKKKMRLPKEVHFPLRQTQKKEYVQSEICEGYDYTYSNENHYLLEKKERLSVSDFFTDEEWQAFQQKM